MGDDRRGRTPRPGSRAPWERYPTAEPTEQPEAGARRSRHADATQDAGSAPLTVQDLVDRVDSERTRRGRRSDSDGSRAGRRAREQAPRPTQRPDLAPRAASSPVADDIAGAPHRAESPADRTATTALPTQAPEPRAPRKPPPARRQHDPLEEPATDILPAVTPEPPQRARPAKTAGAAPPRRPADGNRRGKQARMAGRGALVFFAVLTLVVTGGGWSYLRATNNSFTQVSALDGTTEDVLDGDMQLGDENYLIVGTDTRAGANAEVGAGTIDDAEGSRADTVMLVHIPKNRSRVVVVSFPRDLDVSRPVCSGFDNDKNAYTDQKFPAFLGDKLNAVYAVGGPRCLVDVVRKMSGLSIGHFIGIDFAGFEAMVDHIDGVEVCSTKPIIDGVLGPILETSGKQRVTGETALNYVRARHVIGEERSDYDRIHRQQQFLSALLRGALSSKVLLDPAKLQGFVEAFSQHTFVDGVGTQDLILLGRSLQKVSAGAVTFITAPTAGTTTSGNEIPRMSDIKAIFRAIIDDQPLPGEQTAPPVTSSSEPPPTQAPKIAAVSPGSVSLRVSNGSGRAGVAQEAANKLSAVGFGIYLVGNYPEGSESTLVRYSAGNEAAAATVASSIPGATIERNDELDGIVEVVLGTNHSGQIRKPVSVGMEIPNIETGKPVTAAPVALPADLEHMNAADTSCD
ncbi:LytR family transcriptional regulator [Nocardia asteroides NBRC 15531]|uniref:LytR family transcriptional regulator n=1 Tax=Nocardia asteroides NBRC 15531 TaxID=1110697 RepID=U5E8R8_NOCAS|nr:LCP family protein [Nocardia asteroides]TLF65286.1 LytR family transcriptional regulator [Nocardia asteroides NBRC 15531]GAD82873.1 putative LytR family transcriptional regulator [Nocardia asteroides NBRC 15531]SFM60963.1 transcriptional attenuator, LytR family [Nocardia asteroides]VEG33092.1 Regulatory protein msrR [Nocardia asteroides]